MSAPWLVAFAGVAYLLSATISLPLATRRYVTGAGAVGPSLALVVMGPGDVRPFGVVIFLFVLGVELLYRAIRRSSPLLACAHALALASTCALVWVLPLSPNAAGALWVFPLALIGTLAFVSSEYAAVVSEDRASSADSFQGLLREQWMATLVLAFVAALSISMILRGMQSVALIGAIVLLIATREEFSKYGAVRQANLETSVALGKLIMDSSVDPDGMLGRDFRALQQAGSRLELDQASLARAEAIFLARRVSEVMKISSTKVADSAIPDVAGRPSMGDLVERDVARRSREVQLIEVLERVAATCRERGVAVDESSMAQSMCAEIAKGNVI